MANEAIHGYTKVTSAEYREHQDSLLAKRVTSVGSDLQLRISWSGGNLEYLGYGAKGLASSDTGWLLSKFTWVDGDLVLRQSTVGIWDNRASETYT